MGPLQAVKIEVIRPRDLSDEQIALMKEANRIAADKQDEEVFSL